MASRRQVLQALATGTAGMALLGGGLAATSSRALAAAPARRQVSIGGKRVRVFDVHGHCVFPDVATLVANTPLATTLDDLVKTPGLVMGPERLAYLDKEGIDTQVLSINSWWYGTDEPVAREIVRIQNEKIAAWCAARPDRFVGLATVALQFPELAAAQLTQAVEKQGFRGVSIGGSVQNDELSHPKFDPFWARAEALGVLVFMHPQPAQGTTINPRLAGKGFLANTIGNPLETTVFLSHLIFDGTLDKFPGLKICAAHGGGYLASYSGRSDALCDRGPGADCRALKKRPSEYFKKELFADTMVFHDEGLRHLVAETGSSQILYGTDFPFDWPVGIDFVLNSPHLSAADKEAILGGNAARLFRL
ncbi:MAG: amidohydrolase family protein [Steroidobacteraceae bacterium]